MLPVTLTLRRYLFLDAAWPACAALLIMLGILWMLQSLRFLDFVINKGLGFATFLQLTLLLIPMLLTVILPLAMFAGATYAFKRLQDDNEMTSLFCAGRSRWWISGPAMFLAIVSCALAYGNSFYVLPLSTTAFKDMQYDIRTREGHLLLEEGTFNQLGDNLMVYLKKRVGPTELDTLLVHDTRDQGKPVTWMAKHGFVRIGADGYPTIVLTNGMRQEVGARQLSMLEFKEHVLDVRQKLNTSGPIAPRMREREEFDLQELLNARATMPDRVNQLQAEIHKRLLWPLSPLPLVMMAAALLVRPSPRRRSTLGPVALGTALTIGYMGALMAAEGLAGSGKLWALYGQWLLPVAVSVTAMIEIKRHA